MRNRRKTLELLGVGGEGPAGDPAARLRGAHGAGHRPEGNLGEQEDQEPTRFILSRMRQAVSA